MIGKGHLPATLVVNSIAAINIVGNFLGVSLTFIYFGIIAPVMTSGSLFDRLEARAIFILGVIGVVFAIVAPINITWVVLLVRDVQRKLSPQCEILAFSEMRALKELAGKLVNLPVKLAATTLLGWLIGAIVFSALPHVIPDLFPWPHEYSHKISALIVFVGAPLTMSFIYLAQDQWLKAKMPLIFPADVLLEVPPAFRISLRTKLLVASLVIGCIPLSMVSHVTLHQIHEIQAGRQSIATFIAYMPTLIWFLFGVFILLAAGMSVFVARGVSEPLARLEAAMDDVRQGNLDVALPVVTNDEIGRTAEGFNRMVKEHRELDSVRETFGRYVSREVVEEILKSPGGVELRGELREITILVSDLRGFTPIAESLDPHHVLELMNHYFEKMTEIIMSHGGTIDEFTGDGILVFFGAPKIVPDHCRRAIACALDMQDAMLDLNEWNSKAGLPELAMGIGISTGELVVGNIGSDKRKKYGAIGSSINLAFRIEAHSEAGEILVAPRVMADLDDGVRVTRRKEVLLKGIDSPVILRSVGRVLTDQSVQMAKST